jgi:DNA-binding transcriptional regulator YiaG
MELKGNFEAGVLTSWTEIARYLGKGVRTVQRWEKAA